MQQACLIPCPTPSVEGGGLDHAELSLLDPQSTSPLPNETVRPTRA